MIQSQPVTNALSFDIEDWFHLVGIDALSDRDAWPTLPSLVVEYTQWILQALGEADVRATFFMLGWIAQQHPELSKLINDAGHELATHSYWHREVYALTPEEFHDDIKRSIDVITDQTGCAIRGFRAPSFSIRPGYEWAFDVLSDLGIVYDSSLFPAPRGQGGYPCPQEPHDFTETPSGRSMRELPISVMRVGPLKLPFSGGGYMRLLPYRVIRRGFETFNKRGIPVVVYLHPRDFAPECPRVPMPIHRRFKSYVGLATTKNKLRKLLEQYRFDTCAAVLGVESTEAAPA